MFINVKSIKNSIKNIIIGIKNIYQWSYILYTDRDWDYNFLYLILEFKVKRMRIFFENSNISVDDESIAKELSICELLLKRLIEEHYFQSNRFKELKKISPKLAYKWEAQIVKQDKEMLFNILKRKIDTWWN